MNITRQNLVINSEHISYVNANVNDVDTFWFRKIKFVIIFEKTKIGIDHDSMFQSACQLFVVCLSILSLKLSIQIIILVFPNEWS